MKPILHMLSRVEDYAKAADVDPATVCRKATGNPRLYERLKKRAENTQEVLDKLDAFMRENPVDGSSPSSGPSAEASA